MADLTTEHGRAQAIANGGQEGELARLVEAALEAYCEDRFCAVEFELDSIKVEPDELKQLDDQLTKLLGMVDRFDLLEEDAAQFKELVHKTFVLSEAVSDHLEDVDRQIGEAVDLMLGK